MTVDDNVCAELETWLENPTDGEPPAPNAISLGPLFVAGANAQWKAVKRKFRELRAKHEATQGQWEPYDVSKSVLPHEWPEVYCNCGADDGDVTALEQIDDTDLYRCADCCTRYRVEFRVWRDVKGGGDAER